MDHDPDCGGWMLVACVVALFCLFALVAIAIDVALGTLI